MKGQWIYVSLFVSLALFISRFYNEITLYIVFIMVSIFVIKRTSSTTAVICFLAFFLTIFYYFYTESRNNSVLSPHQTTFNGNLSSIPRINGNFLSFSFQTEQGETVQSYYKISNEQEQKLLKELRVGMNCRVEGVLEIPKQNRNPGLFNYREYLYFQGIHWTMTVSEIKECQYQQRTMFFAGLRQLGIQRMNTHISTPLNAFVNALIFGSREDFNEETIMLYETQGVVHLLAISGLHVGLLVGGAFLILLRLGLTREHSALFLLFTLPIYSILTGASPSVVRSVVMSMIVLFLYITGWSRKLSGVDVLAICFLALTMNSPYAVFNAGFQLSFVVTFFILLSHRIISKSFHFLWQLIALSLIAQLASIPLLLYHFYEFSLLSFFLNLFFVPFFSFILLPASLFLFFTSGIVPVIPQAVETVTLFFVEWSTELLRSAGDVHFSIITTGKLNAWQFCLLYVVIFYACFQIEKAQRLKDILPSSLLLVICLSFYCFMPYMNPNGEVSVIDVGQGDSILIQLPFRKAVYLIDTGGSISFQQEEWEKRQTTFSVGKDIVHPYLKSKGITSLTKLIITHGDHDHGGSALELLDLVDVKELVLGKKKLFSELEQELVRETMKGGTPLTLVGSGDVWKEGEHTFNVLAPFGMEEDTNEQSIVIYTVLGNHRWLFTGDLGEEGEKKLIETFPALEVDVLKVGHHGSKTSTSTFFLEKIQPSYGLVSAGEDNRYNHPHHEVLERLKQNHVKVFRTDKQGALIYRFSRKAGTFQTTLP